MEYLIVWAFVASVYGKNVAFSYSSKDLCQAALLKLESDMVKDGPDDGDHITGECKPFTLVQPRGELQ